MDDPDQGDWLASATPRRLSGDERFTGTRQTVLGFWRWAFSDLQTNIIRGVLAEFLVARALGDRSRTRRAWDDFDVTMPLSDGKAVRVEVKSAAYLQSWSQRRLSRITYAGLSGLVWDEDEGTRSGPPEFRADVYVFALHRARRRSTYDPLDTSSWEFRVVAARALRERGRRSISQAQLERLEPETATLRTLRAAVERAYRGAAPAVND